MSGLRLKSFPFYPGQIIDGPGVDVEKTNGNWTVSLDYDDFPIVAPYTPQPNHYVLVFNSITSTYFLVPATSFG